MTEDNSRDHSTAAITNSAAEPPASAPKKRLEDLLLDDAPTRTTFSSLADQEAKSGNNLDRSLRWPLVVFVILIVAVVGVVVGWYQFGNLLTSQSGTEDQLRVEKRMAVPERLQPQDVVQQASTDAAREVGKADGIAVTEIAEQVVTGVAADLVPEVRAEVSAEEGAEMSTAVSTEISAQVTEVPLTEAVATPVATPSVTENNDVDTVLVAAEVITSEEQHVAAEIPATVAAEPVHLVLVGPFINQGELEQATLLLRERGFQPEQQHLAGTVDMIRLLEGIYPLAQAQQRLEEMRKEFTSAFLLPDGERWALYIGSFSDRENARRQQRDLAERQIQVAPVDSQLTMEGPVLIVVRSGLQAAKKVAAEINASGLRPRIEIER
jgi:hypothetical protein